MGKHADFETTELLQIFRQFGIFRNTLPKEHAEFVKQQLQKDYDTVTKNLQTARKSLHGNFSGKCTAETKPRSLRKRSKTRDRACFDGI